MAAEESTSAAGRHPDVTLKIVLNHKEGAGGNQISSGRLEDLSVELPPGLIAVNALYFKGLWPKPFVKDQTKPQAFHMVSNDVEVPMMHAVGAYNFKRAGDFAAIEMPYRGNRYSLVLVTNTVVRCT